MTYRGAYHTHDYIVSTTPLMNSVGVCSEVASGSDTTSDKSHEATVIVVKLITTSVRENQKQQTSPVSVLVPNTHQRGATSNTITS